MPRRARSLRRAIIPDPKYGSLVIPKFMSKVMQKGKKATAERIVYDALNLVAERTKKEPMEVFTEALKNATPLLQVKARRVGGATYQVPVEISPERGQMMGIRWLVDYARSRGGRTMAEKLASEIADAAKGEGGAIKKKQDTHKMAEANKAFAHFKW
jgi:small subunit ribosomal protein S7